MSAAAPSPRVLAPSRPARGAKVAPVRAAGLPVASSAVRRVSRPAARLLGGLIVCACIAFAIGAGPARAQEITACGPIANAYGPFDYRTQRDKLKVVEDFHFNAASEALLRPMGGHFGGDFDYTLRASPNHHRALIALVRLSERTKQTKLQDMNWTVDCYFDRAMRFAKDDMLVRMIFAGHLGRTNRAAEALAQLDYVAPHAGDNAFTHYNLGLLYLEVKQYDKALLHAQTALQLGLPRTELADALKKEGKWVEPAAGAASGAAAGAVSGAAASAASGAASGAAMPASAAAMPASGAASAPNDAASAARAPGP